MCGVLTWLSRRAPIDPRRLEAGLAALRARVAEGLFREDLYYRLAVVELHVPSLRERKDDIPALVERFLAMHSPPRALADLPPHALDLLMSHTWPGNVRELRNIVARLVLFPDLAAEALDAALRRAGAGQGTAAPAAPAAPAARRTPCNAGAAAEGPPTCAVRAVVVTGAQAPQNTR